jgi:hypothetical protein
MEREIFWLIEKKVTGQPIWLSDDKCFGWTTDAASAFQYETEADALAIMRELPDAKDWFVTDHSMMG